MSRLLGFLCIVLVSAIAPTDARALTQKDLVGAWTLVSSEAFGSNPRGIVIFDGKGHMAWMLMRNDIPKYASKKRTEGTPEENKATVQGLIAQYGTYRLIGSELTIHIEGCSFPNWNGINQKRTNVSVSGGELKWTQPTPSAGGPPAVVVWKRAR
jgi:Lipocalin-like domain